MPSRPRPRLATVCYYPGNSRGPSARSASRVGERHLPGSTMKMPSSVPAAASRQGTGEVRPAFYPLSFHSSMLSPAFFRSPRGHRLSHYLAFITEGALLKNTWSTFLRKFKKALRVWRFFSGGGGLFAQSWSIQENRAH